MQFFDYRDAETNYLRKRDKTLGAAIDTIGTVRREVNSDLFSALVNSIVGQQISTKAQATIWSRMKSGLGIITPKTVLVCTEAGLQSFGVTFKKASYIRGVAERVMDGRLDINTLQLKSDEEVCKELTAIGGIGLWTAEMLMLFSMQRPDILSYGDLAIQRGMRMLYHHRNIDHGLFKKYRNRYSPYGSVASLYLWAIAGGAIEGMKDHALKAVKQNDRK